MESCRTFLVSILPTLVIIGCGWMMPTSTLQARAGTSIAGFDNICLSEARRAEAQHGIPHGLLQSIGRVEAGRKTVTGGFMPWARTLNDRGKGLFFDSREAAIRHLQGAVAADDHSVDAGCMQVNTKWHVGGFHKLGDMPDPVQNADYAAGFLFDLHEAHQSWDDAVKHYHSAEPEKHPVYHRRVLAELERFLNGDYQDVAMSSAMPDAAETNSTQDEDLAMGSTERANGELAGELALRTPATPSVLSTPSVPEPAAERPSPESASPQMPVNGSSVPAVRMESQPNLGPALGQS